MSEEACSRQAAVAPIQRVVLTSKNVAYSVRKANGSTKTHLNAFENERNALSAYHCLGFLWASKGFADGHEPLNTTLFLSLAYPLYASELGTYGFKESDWVMGYGEVRLRPSVCARVSTTHRSARC